jgi:hypothetical protein
LQDPLKFTQSGIFGLKKCIQSGNHVHNREHQSVGQGLLKILESGKGQKRPKGDHKMFSMKK